jgi:CHAT domain-containing protein
MHKHYNRNQQEGKQVAHYLGVTPYLEQDATESRLKSWQSPDVLHIATHGFFLKNATTRERPPTSADISRLEWLLTQPVENPLLCSGLALAGANTWSRRGILPPEAEDGILTAEDVSSLDLLATRLVVLSACETGLGEVQIGEGVFGLRRAFTLAGARTLIMSLWKVPDSQTQELMERFYQSIIAGLPCGEALQQAKQDMKKRYKNPFYWGAFICQGDPYTTLGN